MPAQGNHGASFVQFLGGTAVGLATHEGGHLLFAALFDADPALKQVSLGRISFFALTHRDQLPARQELTIDLAGFWMQHATSEWILTTRADLRQERAPLLKGLLAFNLLTSGAYAAAAFARVGPPERDTRGIAVSLGVGEPWVGAMILIPAVLDGWRYVHPNARWATWLSRAAKVGLVVCIVAAANQPRALDIPQTP